MERITRLRRRLSRFAGKVVYAIRPQLSWQGPIGAALVDAGIYDLAGRGWAAVAAGGFFLAAQAYPEFRDR